jgi:hypothetical protein
MATELEEVQPSVSNDAFNDKLTETSASRGFLSSGRYTKFIFSDICMAS